MATVQDYQQIDNSFDETTDESDFNFDTDLVDSPRLSNHTPLVLLAAPNHPDELDAQALSTNKKHGPFRNILSFKAPDWGKILKEFELDEFTSDENVEELLKMLLKNRPFYDDGRIWKDALTKAHDLATQPRPPGVYTFGHFVPLLKPNNVKQHRSVIRSIISLLRKRNSPLVEEQEDRAFIAEHLKNMWEKMYGKELLYLDAIAHDQIKQFVVKLENLSKLMRREELPLTLGIDEQESLRKKRQLDFDSVLRHLWERKWGPVPKVDEIFSDKQKAESGQHAFITFSKENDVTVTTESNKSKLLSTTTPKLQKESAEKPSETIDFDLHLKDIWEKHYGRIIKPELPGSQVTTVESVIASEEIKQVWEEKFGPLSSSRRRDSASVHSQLQEEKLEDKGAQGFWSFGQFYPFRLNSAYLFGERLDRLRS